MILIGGKRLAALIEQETGKPGVRALERAVSSWSAEVRAAQWAMPPEVQAQYGAADSVGNSRMVFNICGNKYRLVVHFNYATQIARVKFAGTHKEYDAIEDIKNI